MKNFTLCIALGAALVSCLGYSQTPGGKNQQKITESLSEYFKMDREGLHLHLNKSAYLSGEDIWFKGYVIQRQSGKPYAETSNVYVSLLDGNGQKVASLLLYAENSLFEGHLALPENLAGGAYYLQAYTNFMNNFSEDESSVYAITVANPASGEYFDFSAVDYDKADITFTPESGNFIEGTLNTFGVRIADCNGNGIAVKDARVKDAKGNVVTTFSTDDSGYARFDIPDAKPGSYKAVCRINNREVEKSLPTPAVGGICFSVNNYVFPDKATVTVKTNASTLERIKGRPYLLVIQQAQTASFVEVVFSGSELKRTLPIPAENFAEGINSIFLVDPDLKKIGERIIYKPGPPIKRTELLLSQKRGDSIVMSGLSGLRLGSLSISVLPFEEADPANNIINSLVMGPEPGNPVINGRHYMDGFSRRKHYELDNLLLTRAPKYSWEQMLAAPPVKKHDFDKGLVIKGTINNVISDRANAKINLSSVANGLNEIGPVNEKNEFVFENIFVQDSAQVYFSLLGKKDKIADLKLYSQLSGNRKVFLKSFDPAGKNCAELKPITQKFEFPRLKGSRVLDTVYVKSKGGKGLDKGNQLRYNNVMARGYKIGDSEIGTFTTVLDYIQSHGYHVTTIGGQTTLTRNYSTSFTANNSPAIYLDDMPVYDLNMLQTYTMPMIDEVYFNKRGYGMGMNGGTGSIRIYTKKGYGSLAVSPMKIKSKSLVVKDGFQRLRPFRNPEYLNYSDAGFQTLGTIHWEPDVPTDQNGAFRFAFPNFHQQKVKVFLEGIDSEGRVISEIHLLNMD